MKWYSVIGESMLCKTLAYAIMGMLVVYCIKDINITFVSEYMAGLLAC